MVNFLITKITKSVIGPGRLDNIFGEMQQNAFGEIKKRLQEPPILHFPDSKGRFYLHSENSKFATGSALYYIQYGKTKTYSIIK